MFPCSFPAFELLVKKKGEDALSGLPLERLRTHSECRAGLGVCVCAPDRDLHKSGNSRGRELGLDPCPGRTGSCPSSPVSGEEKARAPLSILGDVQGRNFPPSPPSVIPTNDLRSFVCRGGFLHPCRCSSLFSLSSVLLSRKQPSFSPRHSGSMGELRTSFKCVGPGAAQEGWASGQ